MKQSPGQAKKVFLSLIRLDSSSMNHGFYQLLNSFKRKCLLQTGMFHAHATSGINVNMSIFFLVQQTSKTEIIFLVLHRTKCKPMQFERGRFLDKQVFPFLLKQPYNCMFLRPIFKISQGRKPRTPILKGL